MQLHITGALFISVERATRQAGGAGLPRSWLSVKKQVSGQVHILNNTPLILAFLDGTEDTINWYNPDNPSEILHTMDLVEVLVFRERKDDNFSSLVKLVRFCAYHLKRAKIDSSKESRAEVLQYLHEDIELRKLVASQVLNTSEDKVMKPKALQMLLEYNITSKMLNINLKNLRKNFQEIDDDKKTSINTKNNDKTTLPRKIVDTYQPVEEILRENYSPNESIEIAKNIYNRIKFFDSSLPEFDQACGRVGENPNNKNGKLLNDFINRLSTYINSNDDEIIDLIPKMKNFLNLNDFK